MIQNRQTDSEILQEFGIIFDHRRNLSQFGGLATLIAFLDKGKIRERLKKEFGYHRARSMMQFILGVIAGADSMTDVAKLGRDPLVKRFIGDSIKEAQLGRNFRDFTKQEIESLHDFNVSLSVYDFVRKISVEEELVFDIDATAIEKYGNQEGVEEGYVEKDVIKPCYQYLFIRLNNRDTFLYGTIRGGSAHSQNDFCGYLGRFLPMLRTRWRSSWRADSGYFNEAAFDLFSENDATFFIKAAMIESRASLVQTSPDIVWSAEVDGVSYSSRSTNTAKGTMYREVFKRTRLKNKAQLSLGDLVEFRYDCIATNDFNKSEEEVFKFYNGRARIENSIRELKYDYHLGQIITDDFDANDVITQLTLLAYLLMQHFKHEVLPPNMRNLKLSTLRWKVFHIPGRMLAFARRKMIRIQNVFASEAIYAQIYRNLQNLVSWVLAPPILEA
jgi:hypothetical protein